MSDFSDNTVPAVDDTRLKLHKSFEYGNIKEAMGCLGISYENGIIVGNMKVSPEHIRSEFKMAHGDQGIIYTYRRPSGPELSLSRIAHYDLYPELSFSRITHYDLCPELSSLKRTPNLEYDSVGLFGSDSVFTEDIALVYTNRGREIRVGTGCINDRSEIGICQSDDAKSITFYSRRDGFLIDPRHPAVSKLPSDATMMLPESEEQVVLTSLSDGKLKLIYENRGISPVEVLYDSFSRSCDRDRDVLKLANTIIGNSISSVYGIRPSLLTSFYGTKGMLHLAVERIMPEYYYESDKDPFQRIYEVFKDGNLKK